MLGIYFLFVHLSATPDGEVYGNNEIYKHLCSFISLELINRKSRRSSQSVLMLLDLRNLFDYPNRKD